MEIQDDGYAVITANFVRDGYTKHKKLLARQDKNTLLRERAQTNHPPGRTPDAFSGQSSDTDNIGSRAVPVKPDQEKIPSIAPDSMWAFSATT
jgi:hypothetical protein